MKWLLFSVRLGLLLFPLLFQFAAVSPLFAGSREVTTAELTAVHNAYRQAAAQGFTPESMAAIYRLDNAAAAVKKLVDLDGSGHPMSISKAHSLRMEATRQQMNLTILRKLAKITGGTVEVLNFGKMNGIRSDKDQTLYAVDGKRHYTGEEICKAYERLFNDTYKIDLKRMDMELFNGDARVPDWRDAGMSFSQFKKQYKEGEARLMQNEPAYKGGAYRAQVDKRSATMGRVTMTKYVGTDSSGKDSFEQMVDAPAVEASSQYKQWAADVPYRNAMDSCHQNLQRFRDNEDFIDKMKYFNRTIGDGINALALENWRMDYIFDLDKLAREGRHQEIDRLLRTMVNDVFTVDLSGADKQHFFKVIRIAAQIEIDKIQGRFRGEAQYLKPILADVAKTSPDLSLEERHRQAKERFFAFQERIMKHNLAVTARQKIQRDLSPRRLKMVAAKYGPEQAAKLEWETGKRLERIFSEIDDDRLVRRIIDDAPPELRETLKQIHACERIRRTKGRRPPIHLVQSDPDKARRHGPDEIDAIVRKKQSAAAERESETDLFLSALREKFSQFDADLRAGRHSDAEISRRMHARVLSELGFEERAVLRKMEVEFERRFSGRKLLGNVVSLGNADSLINMIRVYQRTGDWHQVAQTAVWELVSNVPGVSQMATLKQAFNDGNCEGLAWMYIAWQMPAAGQVKLVFDVAKGTVEIVYHHMMDPLADDRLAQVYQGYISAQPAGWSPFQPGWKTRQNAIADSILHFVPGNTFPQKRTNMYAYFQEKLDQRLRRQGLDPTTTDYWIKRDTVVTPFFRSYVTDYFEARGEWSENVVAGLKGIGTQEQLKARLVNRLANDFRTGEVLWEDAVEARWQLEKAIAQQQDLRMRNVRTERKLIAAGDFLSDRLGLAYQQAAAKVEKPKVSELTVQAEAYPPVVAEGQAVTIDVKVSGPAIDRVQPSAHPVEIRVARVKSLAKNRKMSSEMVADIVKDADYIHDFVDQLIRSHGGLDAVEIEYDVAVHGGDGGQVLDRRRISVVLAGGGRESALPLTMEGCSVPTGAVYAEGIERAGKRVGYKNDNDRWVGPYVDYFEYHDDKGVKKSRLWIKGCLVETPDGYTTHRGPFIQYRPNGRKELAATVWEGDPKSSSGRVKYHGTWRRYGKNERVSEEINYDKGIRNGPHIEWNTRTGLKERELYFRNGQKHGPTRWWHGDVKVKEGQYRNDKEHGTWRWWDEKSGKLSMIKEYRDGKCVKTKRLK